MLVSLVSLFNVSEIVFQAKYNDGSREHCNYPWILWSFLSSNGSCKVRKLNLRFENWLSPLFRSWTSSSVLFYLFQPSFKNVLIFTLPKDRQKRTRITYLIVIFYLEHSRLHDVYMYFELNHTFFSNTIVREILKNYSETWYFEHFKKIK